MNRHQRALAGGLLAGALLAAPWRGARAQEAGDAGAAAPDQSEAMVAVSADVVEISGSVSRDLGFSWAPFTTGINFAEKTPIPGIIKVANFERLTQMQTSLKMLETEGKAQLLSNPKVITKNAVQANFVVGGDQPYPVTNNQGVGVEFKKFGVILNILPVIDPNKKDNIDAQLQLEVSNPDFSKPVTVGNTTVPSIVTRQIQTEVEIKSGETIVIGGLKSSTKNISKTYVPFLGRIPILGKLFTTTSTQEQQQSLFLFVTLEIVQ
ncbi:MAG: type II and III secretion system protein [Elusimicrobia bacterium]|nr:type II and III secretion system protein [Elusimicrobiota bacterium]